MTYGTIMVTVDTEEGARERVRIAGHLADAFGAGLLGVSAQMPLYLVPAGGPPIDSYVLPLLREACLAGLAEAHALFEEAAAGWSRREWASAFDSPLSFVLQQAARAGLVITGRPAADGHHSRVPHPGDLAMNLGRPLVIVPPAIDHLEIRRIAIGWSATREARRAMADALPFLKRARSVVVCIIEEGGPCDAMPALRYLEAHGIEARTVKGSPDGTSTAGALIDLACEQAADLLVAGAYGHSRIQEWAFGGVTRDLLYACPICCLLSH